MPISEIRNSGGNHEITVVSTAKILGCFSKKAILQQPLWLYYDAEYTHSSYLLCKPEVVKQLRLPLPLGEVPPYGAERALSVTFGDSSPRGGAKASPNSDLASVQRKAGMIDEKQSFSCRSLLFYHEIEGNPVCKKRCCIKYCSDI